MKRTFTKYPVTASQERGTVQTYRNRRNPNKYIEVKKGNDGHSYACQYMEWDRPDGKVKNYTGAKDAKRGRYSRARRDTINQMLEDYDVIESSTLLDEFMSYHEDPDNYRSNESGFEKMYEILDKYGTEDEDVDEVFDRATEADQIRMINLIKPM